MVQTSGSAHAGARQAPSSRESHALAQLLRSEPLRCVLEHLKRSLEDASEETARGCRAWIRSLRRSIAKGEYVCRCFACRSLAGASDGRAPVSKTGDEGPTPYAPADISVAVDA